MPAASTAVAASYALSCIDSGKFRKISFILLPYVDWISFTTGCVAAQEPHWKSANSSTVTAAVGEPSMFGGVAPTGAFGSICCPRGLLVATAELTFVLTAGLDCE